MRVCARDMVIRPQRPRPREEGSTTIEFLALVALALGCLAAVNALARRTVEKAQTESEAVSGIDWSPSKATRGSSAGRESSHADEGQQRLDREGQGSSTRDRGADQEASRRAEQGEDQGAGRGESGEERSVFEGSQTPLIPSRGPGRVTPIPNGVRYEDRPLTATSPDGRITVEVGPSVTASITVESGSPDANGRLTAEVTISQSSSSVIGGQGGGSVKVSGRFEIGRASSTTYKVQVTNEELSQIATGQRPPPDPSDPDSLPVGGSILVTNDGFTDEKYGVAFKGVSLESGTRETEGVSIGVERLDEDRVRVTTGPHQTVLDKLSVGVSTDIGGRRFSVRLSQHENLSTGRTQSVEIDVSTSEGRAAYEAFLRTGRLPAENGAVSNRQSIQRVRYEHGVGGTVGAGFVTVSGTLGDTSGTLTIQEGPEGTTYTYEGDSRPNNRIRARWTQRPDGTREWQEVSFSVANPRPGLIERLLGGSRPADSLLEQAGQPVGAESATLVITGDGFERLQEAARRRAQEIEEAGGTRLDPLTDALVRAQGRDEIVRALGSNGVLDQAPGRLAETLQHYGRLDPTLFQAGSGVAIAAQP